MPMKKGDDDDMDTAKIAELDNQVINPDRETDLLQKIDLDTNTRFNLRTWSWEPIEDESPNPNQDDDHPAED